MNLAARIRPARQALVRRTMVVLAGAALFGPPAQADLAGLDQPADREETEFLPDGNWSEQAPVQ